jgi:putative DNA primase/helicase
MTGGEKLWCEHKYERGFNFTPEYKLWLCGNHEPRISDTTNSIWNRVKKIPFNVIVPEKERIKDYGMKLATTHGPAILNWIVQGAVKWFNEGITEPDKVKFATQAYREGQDILYEFLKEHCKLQPSANIPVADLYNDYKKWCDNNGTYCIGKRQFDDRLSEKGIRKDRGNANKMTWYGIRLMDEMEKQLNDEPDF